MRMNAKTNERDEGASDDDDDDDDANDEWAEVSRPAQMNGHERRRRIEGQRPRTRYANDTIDTMFAQKRSESVLAR